MFFRKSTPAATVPAPVAPRAGGNAEQVLRRLEWTVIRRLDGLLQGDYRTLMRGAGLDLADLREYQHHDDVRHIDWNVTARLGQPHVREVLEERDMAGWAAEHPSEYPPGEYWEDLSAVSHILAEVGEAQFDTPEEYWTYPRTALYDPLGVKTATLETDEAGTWVGSSYLWASPGDWGRFGQMMLDRGTWQGEQILPPGWWELAGTSAVAEGEGAGYGAQTWIAGNPVGGSCKATPGVPEDTLYMGGHWGQTVAMVPSHNAVVVRLGWTFNGEEVFDRCQFLSDVLETLPEK